MTNDSKHKLNKFFRWKSHGEGDVNALQVNGGDLPAGFGGQVPIVNTCCCGSGGNYFEVEELEQNLYLKLQTMKEGDVSQPQIDPSMMGMGM